MPPVLTFRGPFTCSGFFLRLPLRSAAPVPEDARIEAVSLNALTLLLGIRADEGEILALPRIVGGGDGDQRNDEQPRAGRTVGNSHGLYQNAFRDFAHGQALVDLTPTDHLRFCATYARPDDLPLPNPAAAGRWRHGCCLRSRRHHAWPGRGLEVSATRLEFRRSGAGAIPAGSAGCLRP